eukprot:5850041-Pyramimonas_sp.AAC.1
MATEQVAPARTWEGVFSFVKNSNLDELVQKQTRQKRELLFKAEEKPGNAWWASASEAVASLHT